MHRKFSVFIMIVLLLCISGCGHKNNLDTASSIGALTYSTVSVDDAQIAYRIYGKGEPLLMVMGFAGTMDLWDVEFIRELAKSNQVILFDNRGMGASSAGTQPISITRMADDSAGLLDALGYKKANVLGWSMGGLIAQELALNHSEKVRKLILMGTTCDNGPVVKTTQELMKMDTNTLLSHFFPKAWLKVHPDAISKLPHPENPQDIEIIKAQAAAMMNWQGTCSRLGSLNKDTLIISGMDDDILPEPLSVQLADKVHGAWLVRFKNATHWLMYQAPVSLAQTISTFISVREDMLAQ